MPAAAKRLMTVDEFLDFAEGREERWEIEDGVPYAMAPERVVHSRAKFAIVAALQAAIRRAGLPCEALIDSVAVRISARTAYQPDALVYWGPNAPGEAREIAEPVILVEVISPSSRASDEGKKRAAYFSLPSVVHYLVVDTDAGFIVHHSRGAAAPVVVREGALRLDPPGLEFDVADVLPAMKG